jgi:DNA-binding transcriptional LysR family regulator
MNRIELRHFRYAVAVADTLHFGHAAERLHISQPPLSQQIRQLEEELGITLFHRTKRQVQLTKAGELFIQEARVVLAQAEHAVRVGQRMGDGEAGQLIVAIAGPADSQFFVDVFRLFAERHPAVHIALRNMSTMEQAVAIGEGRIHAGFLVPPLDDPALTVKTVIQRPIAVALPARHPLAQRSYVPLSALAAERHIMFARHLGPHLFDAIVSACREAGFTLNVVHEVDNVQTACTLVAAGLGVCFVPAGMHPGSTGTIHIRPVKPTLPHVDSPLALAYKRDSLYELVRAFVNVVEEVIAKPQLRPPRADGVKRKQRVLKTPGRRAAPA